MKLAATTNGCCSHAFATVCRTKDAFPAYGSVESGGVIGFQGEHRSYEAVTVYCIY